VTLGLNRRSSRRIVAAASALIANNSESLPKELRAGAPGRAVEIWRCADVVVEGEAIAREARELAASGLLLSQIAVLCRTNAMARPIAEALRVAQLPFAVIGGHGFYDRPEVKDLIAMLRVVRDPGDLVALARPAAAARQQLLERLSPLARQLDVRDLFDLMEQSGYLASASDAART
jgi:superfamily I DNA/RNA helicase